MHQCVGVDKGLCLYVCVYKDFFSENIFRGQMKISENRGGRDCLKEGDEAFLKAGGGGTHSFSGGTIILEGHNHFQGLNHFLGANCHLCPHLKKTWCLHICQSLLHVFTSTHVCVRL